MTPRVVSIEFQPLAVTKGWDPSNQPEPTYNIAPLLESWSPREHPCCDSLPMDCSSIWNPNNQFTPSNQQIPHLSHSLCISAGLHFRTLSPQPRSIWSSLFVVRFLLSLSTILSWPTSDPFSPDNRVMITHELYCFRWFIRSHTHFISDSIVLSAHSLQTISPYSWLTHTNMVHAPIPRVV